jgi:hypothetical protein
VCAHQEELCRAFFELIPPLVIPPEEPEADTSCGGKYDSDNSPQGNFGDPNCDFSEQALSDLLEQLDPDNADLWWALAFCESSFNPNAHNPNTPDPQGGWGMYQHSTGPDAASGSPFDNGRVSWRWQVINAVAHNRYTVESGAMEFGYYQRGQRTNSTAPHTSELNLHEIRLARDALGLGYGRLSAGEF